MTERTPIGKLPDRAVRATEFGTVYEAGASLYSCEICAAVTSDPALHDAWHQKNVARSIIGGGMFDRG